MKYSWLIGFSILLVFLLFPRYVKAEYLLPYPSFMPGNKLYKFSRVLDVVKEWWYFGTISQFKYHLNLADKYLIEAKTLFEYKQYLLATDALKRSNQQFKLMPDIIHKATKEGKDQRQLTVIGKEAVKVHTETLVKLKNEVPQEFLWTPEKEAPTKLNLYQILDEAISLRKSFL